MLTILLALLLVGLIGAIACSLSCSGYDTAAWVVFFSGLFGAILLSIMFFRKIFTRKNPEYQKP